MPSKWMHVLVIQIEETLFNHVIMYMICSDVFFFKFSFVRHGTGEFKQSRRTYIEFCSEMVLMLYSFSGIR